MAALAKLILIVAVCYVACSSLSSTWAKPA